MANSVSRVAEAPQYIVGHGFGARLMVVFHVAFLLICVVSSVFHNSYQLTKVLIYINSIFLPDAAEYRNIKFVQFCYGVILTYP